MLLTCAATLLIGFPDILSKEDENAINTATKNCVVHFPKEPCLVEMDKTEEHVYRAICGVPKTI